MAATPARWAELKRKQGVAAAYGLEGFLLSPAEVKAKIPILDETKILGGYYVPTDADVRGWYCAAALAELAMATGGVEFQGSVTVQDIQVENGRARRVVTDQGVVECDHVLLCTNVWASVLAEKVGLRFPLMGVEHQLAYTEPLPELAADRHRFVTHPILRHQDFSLYYRQYYDGYGVGNYRHKSMLFHGDAVGARAEREFTPEDWVVCQQATEELLPALKGRQYVRRFNGFMAFSNDLYPIVGETAIRGIWAALGVWVTHAGGVGKAIAELMTHGETEWDLREADINRFHGHDYTRSYMAARIDRQYQEVYDIIHPLQQMENPRNVRLAPYHLGSSRSRVSSLPAPAGRWPSGTRPTPACWRNTTTRSAPDGLGGAPLVAHPGGRAPGDARAGGALQPERFHQDRGQRPRRAGFPAAPLRQRRGQARGEDRLHRTLHEQGRHHGGPDHHPPGAGPLLDPHRRGHGAARPGVDSPPRAGGRLGAGAGGERAICDRRAVGAAARAVLEQVAEEDVANAAFPYYTAQPLRIDVVPAYALRLSYAGELGWEIYAPVEYGLRLWDVLWEAGQPHGIVVAGGGAFDSLRLEKGYRLWGADIHSEYNPFEAGLGWAVRLNKGDFLGRAALCGRRRRASAEALLPDARRAGRHGAGQGADPGGRACGGLCHQRNYGYSVGRHIVYGYLPVEYATPGTTGGGAVFWAAAAGHGDEEPLFDPKMERLKG